jgi:hypothetical protein
MFDEFSGTNRAGGRLAAPGLLPSLKATCPNPRCDKDKGVISAVVLICGALRVNPPSERSAALPIPSAIVAP